MSVQKAVQTYPFLTVDAAYFKVREYGRVVTKALMIAYGTGDDGKREILGFSAYRNESRETWKDFLTRLKTMPPEKYFRTFHGSGVSFTFQRTSLTKLRRKSRQVFVLSCRKCSTARRSSMPDKSGIRSSPIIKNPSHPQWNVSTKASKAL